MELKETLQDTLKRLNEIVSSLNKEIRRCKTESVKMYYTGKLHGLEMAISLIKMDLKNTEKKL